MQQGFQPMGEAVYVRTDSPDYIEVVRPFKTLQDLFEICTRPPANLALDKVMVFSSMSGEHCAVTLGSISTALGAPSALPLLKNK
jgi:hypothetical protein